MFNDTSNLFLILIICGFLLFLFSLYLIRFNLNALFSSKLSKLIHLFTNSKLKSFIFGCITSAIIQSSSGTTAIAISLLSSKYIKDKECLGIIIGANLGTCLTTFIAALNFDYIFLYLISLSIVLFFIFNKYKNYFILIFYIGLMLLGLHMLNCGFNFLINNKIIFNFIQTTQNSILLSTLLGTFITAIVQSSSGVISIVEQMYGSNIINLACSLGIMLGANIGTTITGYISTINTNNTRRIINANLIFNILGVLLFIVLFRPFSNFILRLQNDFFLHNIKLTIAWAHFIFNLVTVILGYAFFKYLSYFINNKLTRK